MSPLLRACRTAVILLLITTSVIAQEITGNIEGYVYDLDGNPIQFANVVVSSPDLQGNRGVMTTSEGYLGVFKLPSGVYTVTISHISYTTLKVERVVVALGKTTTLKNLAMSTQVHEAEEIVVTDTRPLVDETSTEIGSNLTAKEFGDLPLDRDYRNISTLLPMANQSFLGDNVNFSGATGMENRYYVDGVDVTDPGRGLTGTNLPYNFVRELEVKFGGYQAEYRSSLGGILNVVTYSGTNEFRGQVFGFFTNNDFAGERKLGAIEPETGDFSIYDVGATVNGPIVRDRLWFNLAYNPRLKEGHIEVPGTGLQYARTEEHIFAGKFTWRATPKSSVALTVFGDPSTHRSVNQTYLVHSFGTPLEYENPDPALGNLELGGVNGSLLADYFASDNLLFDLFTSVVTRRDNWQPYTQLGQDQASWVDAATGILSGGYPDRTDNQSTQYTADVNATILSGAHTVKTGVGFRNNSFEFDIVSASGTEFSDSSFQVFEAKLFGTVQNRIPSVYLQDSWRATDRLRLNLGIRWEAQFLIDTNGEVAQSITDQWQPRLGFVYQPGTPGTQKVFGSYGRFYHEFSTFLSTLWHTNNQVFTFWYYSEDPRSGTAVPDSVDAFPAGIHPEVAGMKGQYYDEFSVGYERQVAKHAKVGVTGLYRMLGAGVEDGFSSEAGDFTYDNPGSRLLAEFPEMKRNYKALVLTVERAGAEHLSLLASYVLSNNEGNYPGLYNSELGIPFPNSNASYDFLENMIDSDGDLPNDRRHALKASAAWRFNMGFTAGTTLFWLSGTPLNEFVGSSAGSPYYNFGVPRGTAGRTSSIWDLNFRFMYDLGHAFNSKVRPRLLIDLFHVGTTREAVNFDQVKNFNQDGSGNQIDPNPAFGLATKYQPPTAMRLGLEIDF